MIQPGNPGNEENSNEILGIYMQNKLLHYLKIDSLTLKVSKQLCVQLINKSFEIDPGSLSFPQ